ncbi:YadA-like family protein [Providencia stuartii]
MKKTLLASSMAVLALSHSAQAAPLFPSATEVAFDVAESLAEFQKAAELFKHYRAEQAKNIEIPTLEELVYQQLIKQDKKVTPTITEIDEKIQQSININNDYIDNRLIEHHRDLDNKLELLDSQHSTIQAENQNRFAHFQQNLDNTQAFNKVRFTQLDKKITKMEKQANSGIASVAAMSNIPYSLNTRFSAGIGLGHYRNGNAIAAGAQYQLKKDLNLRSSIAWNNADSAVVGAGISIGW